MRGRRLVWPVLAAFLGSGHAQAQDAEPKLVGDPGMPAFPILADAFGSVGRCEVRFAVEVSGRTSSIVTQCSHPVFCVEVRGYISRLRFEPGLRGGVVTRRDNIVMPFVFTREGRDDAAITDLPLEDCESAYVS